MNIAKLTPIGRQISQNIRMIRMQCRGGLKVVPHHQILLKMIRVFSMISGSQPAHTLPGASRSQPARPGREPHLGSRSQSAHPARDDHAYSNAEASTPSMTVLTVNSTSWPSFKRWWFSQDSLPHLVVLQEHKLRAQEDIDEASSFLLRQGYASYWEKGS